MEEAPRFKLLTLLVIVDTIEGLHNHFLGPERPPQCIIVILCTKSPAPPHTVEYIVVQEKWKELKMIKYWK